MCVFLALGLAALTAVAGWLALGLIEIWAAEAGWLTVTLGLLAAPPLALFVHEAGHALAGRAAGMRPVLLLLGPLRLAWPPGRRLPDMRLRAMLPGGFTLSVPGPGRSVVGQVTAMIAGGPAASLLLAAACAVVAIAGETAWRGAAAYGGFVSAGLFLATALPVDGRGLATDGAKLRMLWKGGTRARAFIANLALLGAARRGMPPARWPRDRMEAALGAEPGTPECASALHFAYWQALDADDRARAYRRLTALQRAVAGLSEAVAVPAAFEAAAFHLFERDEPDTARALIEGRRPVAFDDGCLEPLILAGLALDAGDRPAAVVQAKRARKALDRALFPAVAALHARWLERIEAGLAAPADAARATGR